MLKKIIKVALLVSLSMANVSFAAEVDKVVAVVDGDIVTSLEVQKMKDFMVVMGAVNKEAYNQPEVNGQILNFQIDRMLQLGLAKKFNIAAGVSIADLKNNFLQSRGYTEQDLITMLANNNITEKYFLARLLENRQIEQVQSSFVGNKVKITDKMADEFLEKYYNEHTQYLIKDFYFAKDAPKHTALEYKDIIAQAIASDVMPKDISVSDLGYNTLDQLPDIYRSVAPSLEKDKPSQIIAAPNGMHSLLLVDKKEPESIQFEQAKLILYREGMAKEVTAWMEQVKQAAYVKVY